MIIGIEGPAAAGKTTMARTVASEIGATVIEGGSWYRALTYTSQMEGIDPSDTERLVARAQTLDLSLTPTPTGGTRVNLAGQDVTELLRTDKVSIAIGPISQNLAVREVIDPQIRAVVRAQDVAILVGRHIKKLLPEAAVLHLTIDPEEADRRHEGRAGEGAQSVQDRIAADKITAQLLGADGLSDTTVDVTHITQSEQADILRAFIRSQS